MHTREGYLLLGNSGLSEQVMRALELKGDLPQLLDPRYSIDVTVEDLTTMPYDWLRRKIRYQVFKPSAAVAAQHAQFALFPPPNFGGLRPTLVHVTRLTFIAGATAYEIGFGLSSAGGGGTGAPVQGAAQDDRAFLGTSGGSGSTLQVGNAVASILGPTNQNRYHFVPANTSLVLDVNYVLTSRDITGGTFLTALVFETTQLNVAASLTVEFSERQLYTTEQ